MKKKKIKNNTFECCLLKLIWEKEIGSFAVLIIPHKNHIRRIKFNKYLLFKKHFQTKDVFQKLKQADFHRLKSD